MSTVGQNIAFIRKSLGWTQEELALKMGYKSKSTINKIELGINDIPQSKIVKFAEALGTTPAVLMGWKENDISPEKIALSEGEKILIELFRKIPEEKQDLVLQMIQVALGNQE
jgi:transcriptional regulator with XRE-family HTH domain